MDRGVGGWSGASKACRSGALLVCVGLALTPGLLAARATPAPSFAPAKSYPTARTPASLAIADLTGDRKPDLVTANSEANAVSVLTNNGGGSFRARHDYRMEGEPGSIAVGDLNGDHKPDLATANQAANSVSVLLNRGDGSFATKHDYQTRGSWSLAIGDLNMDGKPDLATVNPGVDTVSILVNTGDGRFRASADYATGNTPGSIAIGDLNGDGKPDVATANNGERFSTISVLSNAGDGSLHAKVDYRVGRNPTSVAIGDLSGDAKPELVVSNFAGASVSVLANRGDGSFRPKRDYRTAPLPSSVAIRDLNGDHKRDLAVASRLDTVSVFANRGDASFGARRDYRTSGTLPESIAIGDLNGDRKPELVTANFWGNGVSVFVNTTGLCTVPNVKKRTLPAAKRAIGRANCRVGKIRRAYSKIVKRGRVISERPKPYTVLPSGAKVDLVVSRGRRH